MKTITSVLAIMAGCLFVPVASIAQQTRAFNQNSSRSNHTRALSLSFSPVFNTALQKNNDSILFRGTGAGFRFGGDYFFGGVGLGFVSGFSNTKPDDAFISSFISGSGFPADQLVINKSAQQNMYLLLGPVVRFGTTVQFFAQAKGGLFINNGGLVNIQQKGAVRALYRNEAAGKSLFPGFMTGAGVQYSNKNDIWSLGFGADYLSTRSQVLNTDARRANGLEGLQFSRNVTDLMAGITFRYTIKSPRDAASGQATGKRSAIQTRDAATGLPTGRRSHMGTRDAATGLPTGRRSRMLESGNETEEEISTVISSPEDAGANCGPVTQRTTASDGTVEELQFACPADAAAYQRAVNGINNSMPNRMSMNVTTARQTQGATFGEKVNQGMQGTGLRSNAVIHRDLAARNILYGSVQLISASSTGILTNQQGLAAGAGSGAAAASYAATGRMADGGSIMNLYTREAGSGRATGRRSRETGTGLATGRRQHQPLFIETEGGCVNCSSSAKLSQVKDNPLYKGSGRENENPLFKSGRAGGPDNDCDGIAGLEVLLTDPQSGAVIAATKTGACGEYYFANVPDGLFAVRLAGTFQSSKSYEAVLTAPATVEAQLLTGNAAFQVSAQVLETDTVISSPAVAEALIKTKTRSNQSNDRMAGDGQDTVIRNPHSNVFRIVTVGSGDLDGDGVPELVAGGAQQRPGNPIGGISIKGGKNPGGNLGSRSTGADGYTEFADLEPGTYTFTVEQQLVIDETILVGTGKAQDYNSSRSNKTASKAAVQDHNSSRSNKSSGIAAPDPDAGAGNGKAQDHNSSRSNKTGNLPDPGPVK